MNNANTLENGITKVCNKCGRILPIEKFRLVKGQFYNPYYLSQCKECEAKYQRRYISKKKEVKFSDNLEILIERKYKDNVFVLFILYLVLPFNFRYDNRCVSQSGDAKIESQKRLPD